MGSRKIFHGIVISRMKPPRKLLSREYQGLSLCVIAEKHSAARSACKTMPAKREAVSFPPSPSSHDELPPGQLACASFVAIDSPARTAMPAQAPAG
jgi:hypothetical protein